MKGGEEGQWRKGGGEYVMGRIINISIYRKTTTLCC